ncbi:hypothetical protein D9757_012477 [Collybiopsis confluens]|uniref:Uncharacterized protein n=1 Tax=Collybiopsis confluens TaxID=2823264 RepID=A0A8H5G1B1_9AGAR|nr:hypothetical protein D9757_012477 [Collybiopsis confluens]
MRVSSIVKVVTLSLFTSKASVMARPVQKDAVEVSDSANKVQLEAEGLSSVSFPSSGEEVELFPKGLKEDNSIFLRFFRRKRQISCGSFCTI